MNTDFLNFLPKHECSLSITHNPHKDNHETVLDYIEDQDLSGDFVSEAEKQKAIATNEIWQMQWYPQTPIGFCRIAASTFEALFDIDYNLKNATNKII